MTFNKDKLRLALFQESRLWKTLFLYHKVGYYVLRESICKIIDNTDPLVVLILK